MTVDFNAIKNNLVDDEGMCVPSFRIFLEQLRDQLNSASSNTTEIIAEGDVNITVENLSFNNNEWPQSLPTEFSVLNRDDNLALSWTPPDKLNLSPLPGQTEIFFGDTAPTGWILYDSGTIGNTLSGGTTRANDDTEDLFIFLWDTFNDAIAPVSGGRGTTALDDFNANKTIALNDVAARILSNTGTDDIANDRTHMEKAGDNEYFLTAEMLPAHAHDAFYTLDTDISPVVPGEIALGKRSFSRGTEVTITTFTTEVEIISSKYDNITMTEFNVEQPSTNLNMIIKL